MDRLKKRGAGGHHSTAQSVFSRVLQLAQANGSTSIPQQQWLKQKYTLADVQEAVKQAQERYDSRTQSRVRKWLSRFSAGVLNYGQIMDVLVQHHPEYVSLAWGTTKLLFVLFQNHEGLLAGLAKALTKFSGVLPQVEIQLELYEEPLLRKAAEKIYGFLIEIFHEMVRFYEESPLKHAWKSFSQPLSIRFMPLIEAIDEQSRFMQDFASALAKKEQRSMYKLMQMMGKDMTSMGRDMTVMATDLARLVEVHISSRSIANDTLSRVSDLQSAKIISETKSDDFSEPSMTLEQRLVFCRRHQVRQRKDIDDLWKSSTLKHWSCSKISAIILIQGFANRDLERMLFGTAMVDYVRRSPIPVLWALQPPGSRRFAAASTVQFLKHLVVQGLGISSSSISDRVSDSFNATRIATAATAEHWAEILKQALSGIPLVYIVVDLGLLDRGDEYQNEVSRLFSCLPYLIEICKPTKLKCALISRTRIPPGSFKLSRMTVLDADRTLARNSGVPRKPLRSRPGERRGALAFRTQLK